VYSYKQNKRIFEAAENLDIPIQRAVYHNYATDGFQIVAQGFPISVIGLREIIVLEIVMAILIVVGLSAAYFYCGSDRRDRRGSREHLRVSRKAENAEQQMERDRDYVSDKEKRRYGQRRY